MKKLLTITVLGLSLFFSFNSLTFAKNRSYDFYLTCKANISLGTGLDLLNERYFNENITDEFKLTFKPGVMKLSGDNIYYHKELHIINSSHNYLRRFNKFPSAPAPAPNFTNKEEWEFATAKARFKNTKPNIKLLNYYFDIDDFILEVQVKFNDQYSDNNLIRYTISLISGSYKTSGIFRDKDFVYVYDSFHGNCQFSKSLISYLTKKNAKDKDGKKGSAASSGTAFFINGKGNLITNHHVVNECNKLTISYLDKDYEAKLLHNDKNLDLAVLKTDIKPDSYLSISKNISKKLQDIYAAGYPLGKGLSDDLKITSGIISSIKGYKDNVNQIQIDAAINPGNSGGPIVNKNGYLVGIAVAGLDKSKTESVNFGIKSSSLEQFLISNKIKFKKPFYEFSKNKNELRKLLENSTVYISCTN